MNDLDRLDAWLDRRGMLLDAAAGMLIGAARLARPFTPREQSAWDYATAQADELASRFDALAADLDRRGYRQHRTGMGRRP